MLNDLEIALLKNDNDLVNDCLEEIDRRTAAAAYRKAAEDFGFKTVEFGGAIYAAIAESSRVLGYSDPRSMTKLLDRHDIITPDVGRFGHHGRIKIQKHLDLKVKDVKTLLLPWEGFLLVGMYSQNEAASKVKLYLLEMERAARIALERAQPNVMAIEMMEIKKMDVVTKALGMGEKLTDVRSRAILSAQLEKLTGSPLPPKQQPDLGLN